MQIAVLLILCLVAYVRPTWGLAALLTLTMSLFHLGQYLTIPLPVGYVEPTEMILLSMLGGVVLKRLRLRPQGRDLNHSSRRVLASAILPFCVWQAFCAAVGALNSDSPDFFRFAIRYILSSVLPWALCYILLESGDSRISGFRIASAIMVVTAILHILLQLSDYRPLMQVAYWRGGRAGTEYGFLYESIQRQLQFDTFVRGLPQGISLILLLATLYLVRYLISRQVRVGIIGAVLALAILITLTRSLLVSLCSGVIIGLLLCAISGVFRFRVALRLLLGFSLLTTAVIGYEFMRPSFLSTWAERMGNLAGSDSQIFSRENAARGLDNLAAWAAICDHPFMGVGVPRYPPEYSLRSVPATDIHPMLVLGLVGGFPAIFLAIRMQVNLIRSLWSRTKGSREVCVQLVPFLSVLIMCAAVVNLIGAGGTLDGSGVIALAIIIAEGFRVGHSRPRARDRDITRLAATRSFVSTR